MDITFLGAAGTVTGSRYLLTAGPRRVLVDCGLFQGFKQLRLRNREPFPVDPRAIDAVVLTHAHLDHTGYLPLLVRNGFRGPVYCTPTTRELCGILLPDSGHLQEEEARYANHRGYSRHRPALALYGEADAVRALEQLRPVPFEREVELGPGLGFRLHPAGHIPGAATLSLRGDGVTVLFSGDLGRLDDPILPAPAAPVQADYLVVESTYGNRLHEARDPAEELEAVIRRTAERGGVLLIPSFAVGRAQTLLYYIHLLKSRGRIPDLPVFLDSPMAVRATRILAAHATELRIPAAECAAACATAKPVDSVEESKRVDRMSYPRIIVSASGMATGGRVLHHLKVFAPDPRNTILFAGFQAGGTRGAAMVAGADSIKVHGQYVPVRAEVALLESLSAHADSREILAWLGQLPTRPLCTFITHGEPAASDALRLRIEERLGWACRIPEHGERSALPARVPSPAVQEERRLRGGTAEPALSTL